MYPPTPEANSWTAMNHAAAKMPKVVTDALFVDQGDTETSPSPAPSASKASEKAAATNAPAKTAAHETLEAGDSAGMVLRDDNTVSDMPRSFDPNLRPTRKQAINGKKEPAE
jgi:hypothetical protein